MSQFKKIKKNSNKVLFSGENEHEAIEQPESKNEDLNPFENIEKKFKNVDEDSENEFQNKVEMFFW